MIEKAIICYIVEFYKPGWNLKRCEYRYKEDALRVARATRAKGFAVDLIKRTWADEQVKGW